MSSKNIVKCHDEIVRFLGDFPYERNNGGAIFIHSSIISKFTERIFVEGNNIPDNSFQRWDYDLHIGRKCYKMVLVWIDYDLLIGSQLHLVVSESKYSFPWHTNISIYTTLDKFDLIEKFIDENQLSRAVQRKYINKSRECIDADIKVAEFTVDVTKDILPKFRIFLDMNDYKMPISYFATRAYKYLRPTYLPFQPEQHPNNLIAIINLVLNYHRAQLERGNTVFNIFDLIAMKMAFDDIRLDYKNCEFHKLINRMLPRLLAPINKPYIAPRTFNLNKYHSNSGRLGYSEEIYQYLVTQFQPHFDKLKVFQKYGTFKIKPNRIINIEHLLLTSCYCKKFNIDISSLDNHNSNVLEKIFTYHGLKFRPTISFDTNASLEIQIVAKDSVNFVNLPSRDLHFKGKNPSHFIENLINWMRFTMGSRWDNFDLRFIQTQIQAPSILRGLTVRLIILKNIRVTCKLLRALSHVKYQIIKLSKCYLENEPDIFLLLNSLGGDRYFQINIEDHTIENLMDTIINVLMMTSRTEFQFQNYITMYHLESEFEPIELSQFKFVLSNDRTKLEVCELYSNQTVNLYDYFYKAEAVNVKNDEYHNYN